MHYIYCYTNKINQHKYVGQTNNLQRRIREHRSSAFNEKSSSYNDLIHKKIRQYGEENFIIDVLEILYEDNQEEVNKREIYWIDKMQSFRGTGLGYNSDLGGSRNYSSILTNEQLTQLRQQIQSGESYYNLEKQYNISASLISAINNGVYFKDDNLTYPLYKYYKTNEDYDELIELLLNSTLSLKEISERLNIGYSTVKKINAGTLRHGLYPNYPIRKLDIRKQRAKQIVNFLTNTSMTYQEISDATGASKETIRRVNIGETFNDLSLKYPLRNL